MKKLIQGIMVFLVFGSYWLSIPAQRALALQTENFTPFSSMGFTDELLLGPFADYTVRFGVPASWALEAGSRVVLNIEVSSASTSDPATATAPNPGSEDLTGATLDVTFNDVSLGLVALKQGVQVLEFDIPASAFKATRLDGRHELVLFLNASVDCIYPRETSVLVRASSGFELPHTVSSPVLDLNSLPKPIYQRDSIQPEPLVIVLPDQPTSQEVQAGLIVSAGVGRLTAGAQVISTQALAGFSDEQKTTSHVIFVGKAGGLPLLGTVNFPAAVSGSSIAVDGLGASDGVIQMAVSPWNPALSVTYVGGGDDDAVLKSAQALSSGQLRAGVQPDLTVVTNVASAVAIPAVDTDRTLEVLGYDSLTASGIGFQTLEYNFYVPFGQVAGPDAYFDLVYTHSGLLDFQGSGVLIEVNGQVVSSLRLSEETAKGTNIARVVIPAYTVRPGLNTLTVQMEFTPIDYCSQINRDGLWLNVHKTSLLHLPLISAPVNALADVRDLNKYPALFTLEPTLGNLAFVVPSNDPQSWNVAARIASYLGKDATGSILNPTVAFGDAVSEETRQTRDLIIVGRASQLPIIAELGTALPAPFEAGKDLANESNMLVSYLIPEGTSLGYLQLLPAPWDANRTILAVMGSTPSGLDWSGNALTNPDSIRVLHGNFAVITDTQILTADTNIGLGSQNLGATAVPGDYQTTDTQTPTAPGSAQPGYQRDGLLIAIGFVTVVTIIFLIVFLVRTGRQKK